MRRRLIPLLILLIAGVTLWQREAGTLLSPPAGDPAQLPTAARAELPREARATLALIQRGGPFPYRQDGSEFRNRENRLPAAPLGFYREYTVPTPGAGDRGPRRIVTGGTPPTSWYYSADHYRSFRPLTPVERRATDSLEVNPP